MTNSTCTFTGRRATEPREVYQQRRSILHAETLEMLNKGGAYTTSEIARNAGKIPHRFVWTHYDGTRQCDGHLGEVEWYPPQSSAIHYVLLQMEAAGRVVRYKPEGIQSNWWSLS